MIIDKPYLLLRSIIPTLLSTLPRVFDRASKTFGSNPAGMRALARVLCAGPIYIRHKYTSVNLAKRERNAEGGCSTELGLEIGSVTNIDLNNLTS